MNGLNRPSFERTLASFQSLMDAWDVPMTEARNLLGLAPDDDPWTALDALSATRRAETEKRLGEVGDVYRTLSGIFPDAKKAGEWIHTPLEALEGETPLNVMLREGEDGLLTVMEYLHSLQSH